MLYALLCACTALLPRYAVCCLTAAASLHSVCRGRGIAGGSNGSSEALGNTVRTVLYANICALRRCIRHTESPCIRYQLVRYTHTPRYSTGVTVHGCDTRHGQWLMGLHRDHARSLARSHPAPACTALHCTAHRLYFVCAGFGTRMVWYSFNVALPYHHLPHKPPGRHTSPPRSCAVLCCAVPLALSAVWLVRESHRCALSVHLPRYSAFTEITRYAPIYTVQYLYLYSMLSAPPTAYRLPSNVQVLHLLLRQLNKGIYNAQCSIRYSISLDRAGTSPTTTAPSTTVACCWATTSARCSPS